MKFFPHSKFKPECVKISNITSELNVAVVFNMSLIFIQVSIKLCQIIDRSLFYNSPCGSMWAQLDLHM